MTIIAHLSDTHFGTELPEVVQAVQAAVIAIKPDIVTISGDITQRAQVAQFKAAKEFLDALPADLKFVIPGNHDIPLYNVPLRLIDPYYHYTTVFGLRDGVWCHDAIGIIGFNATSRWRHTRGSLSEEDLVTHIRRARDLLKPGALLVACAHQPLVVGLPEDQDNVLVDASNITKILSDNGVDLVLSGHVHWPLIDTTANAFPDLSRAMVLSGAGTAVSRRTRPGAPNSFNVIELAANQKQPTIEIRMMEYDVQTKTFIKRLEKSFQLHHAGWKLTSTKEHGRIDFKTITGYGRTNY